MANWGLPSFSVIGGREYKINSDYRDVLEIIEIIQEKDKNERVRTVVALALFYEEFEDMPPKDYQEAMRYMVDFINCGEPDDGKPSPKMIDWERDRMIIVSEINKVAGTEVRALPYLHWWTFIAYFNAIGEGQLSFIVSIREKLRKGKKLDRHEAEFYRANRSKVDLGEKLTKKEREALNEWIT